MKCKEIPVFIRINNAIYNTNDIILIKKQSDYSIVINISSNEGIKSIKHTFYNINTGNESEIIRDKIFQNIADLLSVSVNGAYCEE